MTLLIVVHAYYDLVEFTLPEFVGSKQWLAFIDTDCAPNSKSQTYSFRFGFYSPEPKRPNGQSHA